MGISNIVGDLGGAITGVLNAVGIGGGNTAYPKSLGGLVSNVIVENDKSWQKSLGYSFEVVRVAAGQIIPAMLNNEPWLPFTLQINPQELTQDEIFAIEVTPTFSGVLVEHQGTTLKDINISGTTGLSPNRRDGGALPTNGRPVFASGHSGYYEFHELRTYFRAYVEQKRNDPGKAMGELRLVWRNLRDHEHLFVEPQKFTMKRSMSKPHLYEYSIQLKSIGIAQPSQGVTSWLEAIDGAIETVQDGLDTGVKLIQGSIGFIERVERDIANTLLNPVRSIAAAMRELKTGKQRLDRVKARANSLPARKKAILDIGKLVTEEDRRKGTSQGAEDFQSTYEASSNKAKEQSLSGEVARIRNKMAAKVAQALNKEQIRILALKAQEIYDNLADLMGVDTEEYNTAKGRIATLKADIVARNLNYEAAKALFAIKVIQKTLVKMTATNTLFKTNLKADQALVDRLYSDAEKAKLLSANLSLKSKAEAALAQAKTAGDLAAIRTIQNAQRDMAREEAQKTGVAAKEQNLLRSSRTARVVEISGNENIQTIAAKYLGSPDMYKDLVLYNGLKPPYIDPTPLEDEPTRVTGVLRPGDKIFIPTTGVPSQGFGAVRNDEWPISATLTEAERNFGIDIKLTDDFDIEISNTGDVKLVSGSENVAQGLMVKLLLETGALQRHPEIGGGLEVGGKTINMSQTLERVRRSLEADSRVQNVIFAELRQVSSTTYLNLVLKLKNVDQPITVPVQVA